MIPARPQTDMIEGLSPARAPPVASRRSRTGHQADRILSEMRFSSRVKDLLRGNVDDDDDEWDR